MANTLRNGLQVIIQYPLPAGEWCCLGVSGLPIVRPCMIVLAPLANTTREKDLCAKFGQSLKRHLLSMNGQHVAPPCRELIDSPESCHALLLTSCRKLMVIVGDGTAPMPSSHEGITWKQQGHAVLPLLKAGTNVSFALHQPLAALHADSWMTSPTECLSAVLAAAGLVPEESRIFISYRRQDTQELADQLFDELSHHNFDVFLDRFRVLPGLDFQARLTEALQDKSVVLVLESANILQSKWTVFEIDFARMRRLGLLGLQVPGGSRVTQIATSAREILAPSDFMKSAGSLQLTKTSLQRVIQRIKTEHDRALLWRRQQLRDAIRDALILEGSAPATLSAQGLLCAQGSGRTYSIWPALRAPTLPDFHRADVDRDPGTAAVVVGPAAYVTSSRQAQTDWLSQVSKIPYFDEGQVLNLARQIKTGAL